jgi:hypothetical protein
MRPEEEVIENFYEMEDNISQEFGKWAQKDSERGGKGNGSRRCPDQS